MSKAKKPQKNIQKEDVLQAVLIVDDFDGLFTDYVNQQSSAFLPLVNIYTIDYTLECLGRSGIQDTILFCCSHADVIGAHIKTSKWSSPASSMNITIIVSERCTSVGDAMRDLDNKAVIKGDFILLSASTVSNLKLTDVLEYHRNLNSKDKGAAMTLVMQDVGKRVPKSEETVVAVNAITNRLLLYSKSNLAKKIQIPLEYLLDNSNINVFSNLIDTGIAVCSPSVPLLFADNFDFQSKDDFIRGLLLNEEILDSRIYCYQVNNGYGATIQDWKTYQRVSNDVIHRWTYPLVPDLPFTNNKPYSHYRNLVYKQPDVKLSNSVSLEMDVVIGKKSSLNDNVRIIRSVIGKNCVIEKDVEIQDSFIFDNCIIKEGCKIQFCAIGEDSEISNDCKLTKCLIKQNVYLKKKSKLDDVTISRRPFEFRDLLPSDASKLFRLHNEGAYVMKNGLVDPDSEDGLSKITPNGLSDFHEEVTDDESDQSSISDEEESYAQSETEDSIVFYSEVVDSLKRGFEDNISCDNLILEINSSRYAYNVTLSDVTTLTVKAILSLSSRVNSTVLTLITHFLPLFKNYVKTEDARSECLSAIEEAYEQIGNELQKCLHFLYNSDILSEDDIVNWWNNLDEDSPIRSKIAPLIKWFDEASEESSSEE